jgi:3-oxoacyl-[acyl-carrier protein] reductase
MWLLVDLGLRNKACIVTGASRGIGAATAGALEAEGARVLRVSRSSDDFACDVTEPDAAERIVTACAERFGRVDVLVNNAGTSRARALDELTEEDWREQWELNVMAPMRLMAAAAPRMADAGEGRIVNVTSSSGKRPSPRNAAYSVTKAAELSLSRVFADRWAGTGILVNAVMPGPVATPLWLDQGGLADQTAEREGITREAALEQAAAKIPLGRLGTADEIAAVVVFLCSALASNVTGAAWAADGGAVPLMF